MTLSSRVPLTLQQVNDKFGNGEGQQLFAVREIPRHEFMDNIRVALQCISDSGMLQGRAANRLSAMQKSAQLFLLSRFGFSNMEIMKATTHKVLFTKEEVQGLIEDRAQELRDELFTFKDNKGTSRKTLSTWWVFSRKDGKKAVEFPSLEKAIEVISRAHPFPGSWRRVYQSVRVGGRGG